MHNIVFKTRGLVKKVLFAMTYLLEPSCSRCAKCLHLLLFQKKQNWLIASAMKYLLLTVEDKHPSSIVLRKLFRGRDSFFDCFLYTI